MLSYKHGFHAGNHTDVLKHLILTLVLQYVKQKDKPFVYIDTHAGSGLYQLASIEAKKNTEYTTGIKKLWDKYRNPSTTGKVPPEIREYLELIKNYNPEGKLEAYPGSPVIAIDLLREQDRAALFELHTNEHAKLDTAYSGYKRVQIAKSDGLHGLTALLPPIEKRAVVLIDPAYEVKTDYQQLIDSMHNAHRRFATGTYMIWYPINAAGYAAKLRRDILKTGFTKVLQAELLVSLPSSNFGLTGSGMLIINPPYPLEEQLNRLLPYVVSTLAPVATGHSVQVLEV